MLGLTCESYIIFWNDCFLSSHPDFLSYWFKLFEILVAFNNIITTRSLSYTLFDFRRKYLSVDFINGWYLTLLFKRIRVHLTEDIKKWGIENGEMIEKWNDKKYYNFLSLCLVERIEKWRDRIYSLYKFILIVISLLYNIKNNIFLIIK